MAVLGAAKGLIQQKRIHRDAAPALFDRIGDATNLYGETSAMSVELERTSFDMFEPSSPGLFSSPLVHSKAPAQRPFDRLVALQHADGSWDFTKDLADILGCPLAELEATIQDAIGDQKQVRRAWATALAVIWLRIEAHEWAAEWTLLEKKARKWLDRCPARPASGRDWLEAAAEVVS
jgi:hypothetical protein